MVISLHASTTVALRAAFNALYRLPGATGFSGWNTPQAAAHLVDPANPTHLLVHFGYRDGISRPVMVLEGKQPPSTDRHAVGDLLLGHLNDVQFDRWSDKDVDPASARFFRNGNFAALRKIRQHEKAFHDFLDAAVKQLHARGCTENQAFVQASFADAGPTERRYCPTRHRPKEGLAIPTSQRTIKVTAAFSARTYAARIRVAIRLCRRGAECCFGAACLTEHLTRYAGGGPRALGFFFCASLEDQFEHMIRHWIERNPLGPITAEPPRIRWPAIRMIGRRYSTPRDNAPALRLTNIPRLVTTSVRCICSTRAALHCGKSRTRRAIGKRKTAAGVGIHRRTPGLALSGAGLSRRRPAARPVLRRRDGGPHYQRHYLSVGHRGAGEGLSFS